MLYLELIRKSRGFSQKELAERLGVSASYICLVEKRGYTPSDKFKKRSSNFLRISRKKLFAHIDESNLFKKKDSNAT